mmetsp:Transcript_62509/g.179768  ORF Transcript_62509/g.179768 Transcript_62509/m.179768 type:complete len:217 (-) Transcript_62509:33-683(-)
MSGGALSKRTTMTAIGRSTPQSAPNKRAQADCGGIDNLESHHPKAETSGACPGVAAGTNARNRHNRRADDATALVPAANSRARHGLSPSAGSLRNRSRATSNAGSPAWVPMAAPAKLWCCDLEPGIGKLVGGKMSSPANCCVQCENEAAASTMSSAPCCKAPSGASNAGACTGSAGGVEQFTCPQPHSPQATQWTRTSSPRRAHTSSAPAPSTSAP